MASGYSIVQHKYRLFPLSQKILQDSGGDSNTTVSTGGYPSILLSFCKFLPAKAL